MNAEPGRRGFDPELDVSRVRRLRREAEPIADCQRLLANPLLAVIYWLADVFVIRHGLQVESLPVFLGGLGLLFVPIFLIQYHCLDCGATGWLFRSRRHACAEVIERQQYPGSWRRRGPRVQTQVVLWFGGLLAGSVLLAVAYLSR